MVPAMGRERPSARSNPDQPKGPRCCTPRSLATVASEAADARERFAYLDVEPWHWFALLGFITTLVIVDLLLVHRTAHVITAKEAAIESAVWISIGLAFTGVIYLLGADGDQGKAATEYLSGFLIEKSLSIDNVFVWAVIFSFFAMPREYQFRVLFWGIFGALVLRAGFIVAGTALIEQFDFVLYVFGAFLLYTAWKIAHHDEDEVVDYNQNLAMRAVRRLVPDDRRVRRPEALHPAQRQAGGHAAVRGARAGRGHRRGVRGRLGAGDPRGEPREVHRVQLERLRHPRPAVAVLPPRRDGREVPLPQRRPRRDPRLRRREDAAGRPAGRVAPAGVPVAGRDRHRADRGHRRLRSAPTPSEHDGDDSMEHELAEGG